ncbi:hypothetical protein [Burkholderia lata]|uniref:hypothetical protein n=1 Tax=Burkholderia lata (strain ATCC 17760 / DSM 23089 / LMG 22485 / NCIMB 9086 / R18194 / 383) TaxID=482957 RepID=UPI001582706E|nr:hypothetical protein [Burkholderia lata]
MSNNDNNANTPNVSGLTLVQESLDGIGKLHPVSLQKSLVGINSLRPNVGGVTSNASQTQPVASSTQAPTAQANNSNSKGK